MAVYTQIDNPELYFQTELYSGDGSTDVSHTFDGSEDMQPDMVWFKRLNGSANHFLYDAVRGANRSLVPNDTDSEATSGEQTTFLSSFDSDGFTLGDDSNNVNGSGQSYVLWGWKAGGGSGSANTDGSINTASTSANTTSKFSIGKFNTNTATSSSSAETIGHGLSGAAKMVILKPLGTDSWYVFHARAGNNTYMTLDGTGASTTNTNTWNNTAPTSSVFSINTTFWGKNTNNIAAYCFADVQGFSKFGKYTGNGNADGPFVNTGFRPAFIMFKPAGESADWTICDTKRNTFNVVKDKTLNANLASAEHDGSMDFDILSNGFKVKNANTDNNSSNSAGIIYMAFAEQPFVNSNGVPCNAR